MEVHARVEIIPSLVINRDSYISNDDANESDPDFELITTELSEGAHRKYERCL